MSSDKTYNGWTNYETWLVKLWIDNDQGSQEYWLDEARRLDDVYHVASALKDWAQEFAPETTGMYADLMNAAISSVEWYEIAESLLEDVKEQDEE
jgi:leucyl aminopeptidase (aminopeptidase T)